MLSRPSVTVTLRSLGPSTVAIEHTLGQPPAALALHSRNTKTLAAATFTQRTFALGQPPVTLALCSLAAATLTQRTLALGQTPVTLALRSLAAETITLGQSPVTLAFCSLAAKTLTQRTLTLGQSPVTLAFCSLAAKTLTQRTLTLSQPAVTLANESLLIKRHVAVRSRRARAFRIGHGERALSLTSSLDIPPVAVQFPFDTPTDSAVAGVGRSVPPPPSHVPPSHVTPSHVPLNRFIPHLAQSTNDQVVIHLKKKRNGSTKLYWNGYEYTRANATMIKITYRCSFYRRGCEAKLVYIAVEFRYDYENCVPHTCSSRVLVDQVLEHPATSDVRMLMKREIDRIAVEHLMSPQDAWDAVSRKYLYAAQVPVRGLLKSQVIKRFHNARSQHYGKDIHGNVEMRPLALVKFTELNFFQFHFVWTVARNSRSRGKRTIDRLIGWAHPALMPYLASNEVEIFIDGTFACAPPGFQQCIIVMIFDRPSELYIPIFHVLSTTKSHDGYWNVFQLIRNACGSDITPSRVVCDFEQALLKAVADWFPKADVLGCYFHFKQACQRYMVQLRLSKEEIKIATAHGVLDMLCVVEPTKIWKQGAVWVKKKIQACCDANGVEYSAVKWRAFWAYFERTWIKLNEPKFWNVWRFRDKEGKEIVARTNNPLERYNKELNEATGSAHPTLTRFIQTIEEKARRLVKLRDDVMHQRAEHPVRKEKFQLQKAVSLPEVSREDEDDLVGDPGVVAEEDTDDSDESDEDGDAQE